MIRRRIVAAVLLYGFAIGSALYWNDWQVDRVAIGINVILAAICFMVLHRRWKRKEAKIVTPKKARDIFS